MFKKLRTIKGKQLALAVVVSAVPLLIIGHLINNLSIEQIRTNVKNQLQQVVSDKAHSIEQWLAERKADIHLLASTRYVGEVLTTGEVEEFEVFWTKFRDQYGVYDAIRIFDTRDELVYASPEEPALEVSLPELPEADSGQSFISDAFLWEGTSHFLIVARAELDSRVLGLLVAVTSLDHLNRITDNIRIGETGEAYLVNSSGLFVTHQNRNLVLGRSIAEVEPIARLLSGEEESFVGEFIDYRGIPVLGAYYYLPELGWGLVAEQDVEEAFAPAHNLNRAILLTVLLSSLVVAVLAYIISSNILRPLGILKQTIERIREGELDVRFPVERSSTTCSRSWRRPRSCFGSGSRPRIGSWSPRIANCNPGTESWSGRRTGCCAQRGCRPWGRWPRAWRTR